MYKNIAFCRRNKIKLQAAAFVVYLLYNNVLFNLYLYLGNRGNRINTGFFAFNQRQILCTMRQILCTMRQILCNQRRFLR